MSEQNFNTRIIHKHDIESNWIKAVNFIPLQGEIIVYDIDENYNYERVKIGDGIRNVNDLPFVSTLSLDDTLSVTGSAADAKATGDAINQVRTNINEVAGLVGDLDSKYYTETEVNSMIDALNVAIDAKSYVQMITWEAND